MATAVSRGLVAVERRGAVAVLTLTRPEKLNALSSALESDLDAALDAPEVTESDAVVITGGSEVFSAGADVTEMREMSVVDIFDYYKGCGGVYERLARLDVPSVAAIAGYCLGGGFELALAADFRIAEETAIFGLPEVGIGIVPSSGGIVRLVRAVGTARARELVLARPRVSAAEAAQMGLVTEVVPVGRSLAAALELAKRLAALPRLASTIARRAIDAAGESSHAAGLLVEQLAYTALSQVAHSTMSIGGASRPEPDPEPR